MRWLVVAGALACAGLASAAVASPPPAFVPVSGSPFTTGIFPYSVAYSPDGGQLAVANAGTNSVSVFAVNATSGARSAVSGSPFAAGTGPRAVAYSPGGGRLAVANTGVGTVSVFTLSVPANSTPPSISGTAQQGETLSADPGSWTGSPTSYTYQWQRCDDQAGNGAPIGAATSQTYTPTANDVATTLKVAVIARNAGGASTASTSTPTPIITATPTPATPSSATPGSPTPESPALAPPTTPAAPTAPARLQIAKPGTIRHNQLSLSLTCPETMRTTCTATMRASGKGYVRSLGTRRAITLEPGTSGTCTLTIPAHAAKTLRAYAGKTLRFILTTDTPNSLGTMSIVRTQIVVHIPR
ncbi:MAG: beta-propeller fold lactonase family protein [Gaiellales bacterium]